MAVASGLAGQWGAVDETTYGVAPSLAAAKFYACDSDTLKLHKVPKDGTGIYAGAQFLTANRRYALEYSAGGALPMDLPERGLQQWLLRMMGSYGQSAATLTQDGVTGAYKSVHAPGFIDGRSFCLQAGRPDVGGTVSPATYVGCKVADWEIACAMGEIAKLTLTIEARNELFLAFKDPLNGSVPALQAFVPPAGGAFRWVGASVHVAGTPSTSPLVAAPAAPVPTTNTSGGTVLAGTYQVTVTYVDSQGETTASASGPVTTTGSTSTITVPSPAAAAYATGWYAYVSQAGGTALSATRQQAPGSPTNIGTNLTLTAPPTSTGAVAQTTNTTGQVTTLTSPTLAGRVKGPISVKYTRALDLARWAPDVAPFRNEPLTNGRSTVGGQLVVEWLNTDIWTAAYQNDTATAIQYTFLAEAIGSGADIATLDILVPNVRLNGESPSTPGVQILTQAVPWEARDDGVNNPIQLTYWTTDAA